MEDLSQNILNDIEKDKIAKFAEDKFTLEAVKKYILAVALKHGVFEKGKPFTGNMNWALQLAWGATESQGMPRSDEELGQNLRALTVAVKLVESGFKELAEFKKVEPLEDNEKNPAE
jgi:hypothetical protein